MKQKLIGSFAIAIAGAFILFSIAVPKGVTDHLAGPEMLRDLKEGQVNAVNPRAQTITIAGQVYTVSRTSRLFDVNGYRVRLAELTQLDDEYIVGYTVTKTSQSRRDAISVLQVMVNDSE